MIRYVFAIFAKKKIMPLVAPFTYEGLRYYILSLAKILVSIKAKLLGQSFYCKALGGESSYNIVINSDLSVSCNCTDYYGDGQLGSLHADKFEDVFRGEKANRFRNKLANGNLPIWVCVLCRDRQRVSRKSVELLLQSERLPDKGIMVENNVNCNLTCTSCPRKSLEKSRSTSRMVLSDIHIVAETLKRLQMKSVAYFNLGEPFMSKSIFRELSILKEYNPETEFALSTNGQLVDSDEKREAALLLKGICFSVHGCDTRSLQKYQKGAVFERAYENMRKMVEYRDRKGLKYPQIEWKYVLFRWNDNEEQINKAIELAKKANVDLISFWPTFSPPYAVSIRYLRGKFNTLGVASGTVRQIYLRR